MDKAFEELAAKALARPKFGGRQAGSTNYLGVSAVAKSFRLRGVYWMDDMADAYLVYKKQWLKYLEEPGQRVPDAKLLEFWMTVLPYLTVKMVDRPGRVQHPRHTRKHRITPAAIQALERAEGKKQ